MTHPTMAWDSTSMHVSLLTNSLELSYFCSIRTLASREGKYSKEKDVKETGVQKVPDLLSASLESHYAACPAILGLYRALDCRDLRAAARSGEAMGKGKPYSGSMETIPLDVPKAQLAYG